ncbi:MAG: carbohydrate ABC transporter permease [Candidatus Atribacteria bacterium]|nr:carbohydrate ABC transporter permease [Candidatus Atribacteria bacterium]
MMNHNRNSRVYLIKAIGLWFAIVIITIIVISPSVWLFLTSLKHPMEIFRWPPTIFPQQLSFEGYKSIFHGYDSRRGSYVPIMGNLYNSLVVGLISSIFSLIIGSMAAYVFARGKIPYGKSIFLTIMVLRTIPLIALAVPLYKLIGYFGLINTLTGLTITHLVITFPIVMFVMYNYFSLFPSEIEDAAQIDGCGPFGIFLKIIVPISAPSLASSLILAFVFSYNEFLFALTLLSDNNRMTLPVGLASTISTHGINWDLLSSAGTIAVIPCVFIALYVQRYLLKGLWSGAIK